MTFSLRTKTIIGIGLIEAVLLASLVTTVMFYMRETNQQQLQERVYTTTSLFATTTKDAVLSYDLASLEDFTHEVMKNPGMVYARVLGPENTVFSESGDRDMLDRPFVADGSIESVTDSIFDNFAEISEDGVIHGRVELGIDTNSIDAYVAKTSRLSAAIAIVEMVLVALFSLLLGRYLTGQLKTLTTAAKAISNGKLDVSVPVKGSDEIADVAHAFNRMTEKLQLTEAKRDEYERKLLALNTDLEDRVRRRTQTLEEKNHELSLAYDKLKEAQSHLLQSEKMASVGQLAAGVAHEINNPVGFISSNLESLREYLTTYRHALEKYASAQECDTDDEKDAILQEVHRFCEEEDIAFIHQDIGTLLNESIDGSNRVRDIVLNLRNFSHVDTTEKSATDINACLESTLKIVNNEIKYTCEIVRDFQTLPEVNCVVGQVNQVFLNLIINASQAVDKQGTIHISTRQIDDKVEIKIRDNGCGIEQENLAKLFDPFFTTKPVGEGTGLGLAIVYGIVQDHHGEITVSSELGKGTCFSVILPIDGGVSSGHCPLDDAALRAVG